MTEKGFVENGFIVDLSNANDSSEIINELSSILDMQEAQNKKICLKIGKIDLSQSQLLSIKSLISSMNSALEFVDTESEKTELSALEAGIIISKLSNEIEIEDQEQEPAEADIKEMEIGEPKDGLSYSLSNEEEEIKVESVEIFEAPEELEAETEIEPLIEEKPVELSEAEIAQIKEESEQEIAKLPTLYLQQTLRSGQTMSYDGNIVLIGDANPGSEIIARGDITVWGILGGIAHAGARGNDYAKIRALKLNAIQLRISGFYARRPDSANIPFIQRTSEFTPEVARVNNKEIAIYKINEG